MTRDANSKFGLQLSADGVKVSAEGDGASRLAGVLADLLSPFSGALGYVGDQLTYRRYSAAVRAAAHATKLLQESGVVRGNVPPKILIPWLEGASLEIEDSDSLTEAWGGLFARAVKSADAANISYVETLRKIGTEEAKLLKELALRTPPHLPENIEITSTDYTDPVAITAALESVGDVAEFNELSEKLHSIFWQDTALLLNFTYQGQNHAAKYCRDNRHAISNLEHLGLLRRENRGYQTSKHFYQAVVLKITRYAFDFIWACQGFETGKLRPLAESRTNLDSDSHSSIDAAGVSA